MPIINCLICGKEKFHHPSQIKRGGGKFCSTKCQGKWKSIHNKGKNNPTWKGGNVKIICRWCGKEKEIAICSVKRGEGKYCSHKCYGKSRIKGKYINCKACNKKFYISPALIKLGRKNCSKKCMGIMEKGESHHNWQGGITPLTRQIRKCSQYREWQIIIIVRDKRTCTCGSRTNIEVDHFPMSFAQLLNMYKITTLEEAEKCEALWDTNNGRVLCHDCHIKTPTYRKPLKYHPIISLPHKGNSLLHLGLSIPTFFQKLFYQIRLIQILSP